MTDGHDRRGQTAPQEVVLRAAARRIPRHRHGDLYAWGSGWRGELGLGDDRQMRPEGFRKVPVFGAAAGDRHTLAIALKHKAIGELRESRPLEAPNAHAACSGPPRPRELNYACARSSPTSPLYPHQSSPKAFERTPKYCKTCDC